MTEQYRLTTEKAKELLLRDLEKKTPHEFYHDGMKCQSCGYPVRAGDAMYIIGGVKCCEPCRSDVIEITRSNL